MRRFVTNVRRNAGRFFYTLMLGCVFLFSCGESKLDRVLVFLVQPSEILVNEIFVPSIKVAIQDVDETTIPTATDQVTLTIETNPTGANLGGTLTVKAQDGFADFADISIDSAGRGFVLEAKADGIQPVSSKIFDVWASLQRFVDVSLTATTLTIEVDKINYDATVFNHSNETLENVVVQGYVDQGEASRAAGGSVVHCTDLLGVLPPGECKSVYVLWATNTGSGHGTLVPGEAKARFDLKIGSVILDSVSIPITLVD